jgi:drug/metabolite transporter (DMT)-like permease
VTAVAFAALSGALFGAMAVAVRRGLGHGTDPEAGALVIAGVAAFASVPTGIAAAVAEGVKPGDLWPFALAGAFVPGCTQLLFIVAVRDAGPSRAAILIGTAPLASVVIALAVLGEPFHPLLLLGTLLIVAGGVALARERVRPEHFRATGVAAALTCAALFAVRDNVVRWAARGAHPPALTASLVSLTAAAAVILLYTLLARRRGLPDRLRPALPAFAPAGLMLALAYACLFVAFDHGSVSVVAPLNATQSLWAVAFAALVLGISAELIGRRLVVAAVLVVCGAALIGALH